MSNRWNELFNKAILGDEESIAAVAQRLETGPSEEETRTREDFLDASSQFREDYRDLVNNPEDLQRVIEIDAQLARQYPKLGYAERMNIAGNAVRAGVKIGAAKLDAGRSDVIRQMRESRKPREIPMQGATEPDDNDQQAIRRRGQWRGTQTW